MKLNKAKMRMMAGKPALGTVLGMGSPEVAGVLARSKFDFLLLDAQHGAWNLQTAGDALWNIGVAGHIGMVRVVKNDFFAIGSMLDRGALGVVVPMVETVEEARAAVDAARYAPQGRRSVGGSSMRSWQSVGNDGINEEIFMAVQIETRLGVERAAEILAVDGVDGCWIGPSDLAREGHSAGARGLSADGQNTRHLRARAPEPVARSRISLCHCWVRWRVCQPRGRLHNTVVCSGTVERLRAHILDHLSYDAFYVSLLE